MANQVGDLKKPLLPQRFSPLTGSLSPKVSSHSSSASFSSPASSAFPTPGPSYCIPGKAMLATKSADWGLMKKKKPQGLRSWIQITSSGEVNYLEADKSTIMRRCELPGRDLRLLDPVFVYPSTLLRREKAIVVNLESIRCIISAEEVLLLNPPESEGPVLNYTRTLQGRLLGNYDHFPIQWRAEKFNDSNHMAPSGYFPSTTFPQRIDFNREDMFGGTDCNPEEDELPFEFKALEVALELACQQLDFELHQLSSAAYPMLEKLAFQISTSNLEMVRRMKSSLLGLTRRVQKVWDEIEHLINDDGDMAAMYLTEKKLRVETELEAEDRFPEWDERPRAGELEKAAQSSQLLEGRDLWGRGGGDRERNSANIWSHSHSRNGSNCTSVTSNADNVEVLEMLLEAYFVVIDGTLSKLTQLSQYIDDTEDFINIQLDNVRNQLMQFELIMTTAGFVVGLWAVVMGFFGMNIPLMGLEKDPNAVKWIIINTFTGGAILFIGFLGFFRYKNWTVS